MQYAGCFEKNYRLTVMNAARSAIEFGAIDLLAMACQAAKVAG